MIATNSAEVIITTNTLKACNRLINIFEIAIINLFWNLALVITLAYIDKIAITL